ncbi:GroES-like protein [Penicillium lagena]|uniref:GroES-like protein n=1 Tax=Penicillium lagena TaxID=94218 RepID=UPI0025423C53|nr:GroES-like protein [Penicillium lagena]KAJ5612715.1 GroES-like protein [Penicillium lagena]
MSDLYSACGPREVRLQIAYCGICGSDIHEYLGGPIFPPKPGHKNPWTGQSLPVTLGHEMSGTVVEIGSAVANVKVGAKVAVNPALDDRHHGADPCTTCKLGKRNICKRYASYGLSADGGGFASEIVVNEVNCITLPESVSLQVGALLEPLAVAWHSIRLSGFVQGQTVLVLGAGPIGLAIVMLLRVWGAKSIFVSEVAPSRKRMAKDFGATIVVDPTEGNEQDPVQTAVHSANPDGVDVAFDAIGLQITLDTAIASIRPGGTVFNVAIHEKPLQLNLNNLACFEKRLIGGICYTMEDFVGVLKALESGEVPAEKMITSIVPLSEVVEKGFLELIHNKEAHVKILIQPDVRANPELARL